MRCTLRPATLVLATALLALAACASPTAPTSTRTLRPAGAGQSTLPDTVTTKSGFTVGQG